MNQKVNRNKGFSLIELLISIAILAIIMVMISGFLTSTLRAQKKTKKDMQVQSEAQRIYYQLSDILMQATYIRVQSQDGKGYTYDSSSNSIDTTSSTDLNTRTFVPDNYANYQENDGLNSKKVIVDFDTFDLYDEDDKMYPAAGSKLDGDSDSIKSFRALTQQDASIGDGYYEYYYIIPEYIYVECSQADTSYTETGGKVTSTSASKTYVIFKYDSTEHKLYMYRYDNSAGDPIPSATQKFSTAVTAIDAEIASSGDEFGFLSEYIEEFYLSANPDENALSVWMKVEDERYKGYTYTLKEFINIRNSNVLTVKPQLLRKRKKTTTTLPPATP